MAPDDLKRVVRSSAFSIPPDVEAHLGSTERACLDRWRQRFHARQPALEDIWQLMDQAWTAHGCDAGCMDDRISRFYSDPVWLLNGLFVEQDAESQGNRRRFCDWVKGQRPVRVADYGGGFGGLARMIGIECPNATVEIIEPHPHAAAIALAAKTGNVRYRSELSGSYDILIATDVFEHVPDPLALFETTAGYLRPAGHYLTANCFWPVIRCHLPQNYHFRHSWNAALRAMGMKRAQAVCYGWAFERTNGALDLSSARKIERQSRSWFPMLERIPTRSAQRLAAALIWRR